jgi:imidazolonepropionase-like amidohydrolase
LRSSWDYRTWLGTLEPGKLADIIAVPGNRLENITALEHAIFVMKGESSSGRRNDCEFCWAN